MRDDWVPESPEIFSDYLNNKFQERVERKAETKKSSPKRKGLNKKQREVILEKTGGKCHRSGGDVEHDKWQADHVLAHSGGGVHQEDNYLPAHHMCNLYRWDYLPEEFQEILRLGVWLRTQIQNKTPIGRDAAAKFLKYESQRLARRKKK